MRCSRGAARRRDFRLSIEEFRTALSIKDDEALAVAGLAMVDFYENRVTASVTGMRRAVYLDPNEPDYHFNLGQVTARSERYAKRPCLRTLPAIAPRTDADRRARIRGIIDFLRYLGTQRGSLTCRARRALRFLSSSSQPAGCSGAHQRRERTLRFVIDTGSGMCVLAAGAARRLGIRPVARGGMARAVGGGGRFDIIYGFLSALSMATRGSKMFRLHS